MYLHEYQSKQYFARFGIQTPLGKTAATDQEAYDAAVEIGVPVVVNAQTLDSQRVFRLAQTPEQARRVAADILALTISGVRVGTVLIEPAIAVIAEYFLGLYGDRGSSWLLVASDEGGHDIIEIERDHPQTLSREFINPFLGVLEFQARNLASGLNLPREQWTTFTQIAQNLYRCAVACDAVRAEINPLGLTSTGESGCAWRQAGHRRQCAVSPTRTSVDSRRESRTSQRRRRTRRRDQLCSPGRHNWLHCQRRGIRHGNT